ncbi:GH36-type glycosyl hydrolase domain-containing protein [Lacticaseibacillus nasuensis]|uniref:GH36-type glycosyl hydrolase domain-containing protein n=1 Tax=Lacticaseibacillus nasuensis TaxID=944671 RepID=UPI00224821F8|nr:cellobiose phosphorylase [Lacticaseibacillus nasuensis]MCX2455062.1 cellobiose phosphorylase [Lacticaseibacillus nasuensis]
MPTIANSRYKIELLPTGEIKTLMAGDIMLNLVSGNSLDGSMGNLYLRVFSPDGNWESLPLLGNSAFAVSEQHAQWQGTFEGVTYTVTLSLGQLGWYWQVTLKSETPTLVDLTYLQDLGLGDTGFVTSNEAYASQYVDHYISSNNSRVTIASRQNQLQSTGHPYIQQGSFEPIASYATDGSQVFGPQYRLTDEPIAQQMLNLPSQKEQGEQAVIALRTPQTTVNPTPTVRHFYAGFIADQPAGNFNLLLDERRLRQDYESSESNLSVTVQPAAQKYVGKTIVGRDLSPRELEQRFGDIDNTVLSQVERDNQGEVLSFFTAEGDHVVLPQKERQQSRMTGNIVISDTAIMPQTKVMAATQFMPGVFASHVVFGNTNMNILTTHTCDAENFFKVYGTRIYLKKNGQLHLLTMPSWFKMSYDGAEWGYVLDNDVLVITSDAGVAPEIILTIKSTEQREYEFVVTNQLSQATIGHQRIQTGVKQRVDIHPGTATLMGRRNPQLSYVFEIEGTVATVGDGTEFVSGRGAEDLSLLSFSTAPTASFIFRIGTQAVKALPQLKDVRAAHAHRIEELIRYLTVSDATDEQTARQTNLILRWFAHDALVHLLSPHGLEQYGGAAWGTRDVSQGPTELFLSTGHYAEVRKIVTALYSHQHIEDGNWSQWFMFDEYSDMFADESHGDVIVWPLKVVVDYLDATGDAAVLDEKLPYVSTKQKAFTQEAPLRDHIKRQIEYLENHFLYDTHVSAYGDGDWDDTLQPAHAEDKKTMASTWTEELTIETLRNATRVFPDQDELTQKVSRLADVMWEDFKRYFMQWDTLPGFISMTASHEVTPIIHPTDKRTGVKYRLLPLSQGVLSHILVGKQAESALSTIRQHLLYPDGVRLMDRPSTYHGGVSEIFKRGEQSANFGREIGLLYVHAHIRYADAVAQTGDLKEAWRLLQLVNPISLTTRVSNADLRQANVYFSSSDADFHDRYQAQNEFQRLREQSVRVKGGWRLYSSGPGIFIGTLLTSLLKLSPTMKQRRSGSIDSGLATGVQVTVKFSDDGQDEKK